MVLNEMQKATSEDMREKIFSQFGILSQRRGLRIEKELDNLQNLV